MRGDTDRVYNIIQEREVIETDVGEGGGGAVGSGDRAGVEMVRNVAYGHVGEGGGGGVGSGDRAGVEMVGNIAYGHVGESVQKHTYTNIDVEGWVRWEGGDRVGVEMVGNTAYGHVGEGVGASGDVQKHIHTLLMLKAE